MKLYHPFPPCKDCTAAGFDDCIGHTLEPNENSGRGSNRHAAEEQRDAWKQIHEPIGYRLNRGFAIMSQNKHDL